MLENHHPPFHISTDSYLRTHKNMLNQLATWEITVWWI